MSIPIQILLVEDMPDDAFLILRELQRAGYEPEWTRVDSARSLMEALPAASWDVITCDWTIPGFGAEPALRIIQDHHIDTPVIIVSGEVDEETAVRALKGGANDFVSKHRLARLVPAIEREMREAGERAGRRNAEADIRHSEANLRAILNNSLQSFVLVDSKGNIRAFNQIASVTTEIVFGARALAAGADLFSFVPKSQHVLAREEFARALAGEVVVSERCFNGVDGDRHWFEINHIPIRENDAVTGVCVSALDITRHRKVEEALRRSEQRLRTALMAAQVVAWEWNIDCDELVYSESPDLGLAASPPLTFSEVLEAIDPADREHVATAVRASLADGRELETQFHIQCRNGSLKFVEQRGSVLRDESGRTVGVAGIAGIAAPARARRKK
jgi:PAS domain S-box-containing protein